MSDEEQDDPLERLFVAAGDDVRPVDGQELDTATLRDRLDALADAAEAVDDLVTEANNLSRTGLRESDLVALIVGRKPSRRSLRDVEALIDTLQEIQTANTTSLLVRLLADLSDLNQTEAEEYLTELRELHERYPPESEGDQ